ncbi:uncharacterized protein LOC127812000 isoform X2 [Diospyros lotus]|uniref:uncharacterized protein LOC127812000 isoform X2 n=1 Tax=Diospyros lotus TaxID=55363 RepID=UPI00225A5BD9|nr:uncharacterized protein LOC127812000 isoform X2 [Diospyros lotus]
MSSSTEVASPENVVQALLEYLVDPLLPLKPRGSEPPPLHQQQSVAKQMHAVVLLYNYFHRKQHAESEFLGFQSFCKLAVTLRPALLTHVKLMHQSDSTELNDLEEQLSVTEKAIKNACDIALVLDASEGSPNTEGWPVSRLAMLSSDSSKEHCLLEFSSITQGVWSVIEKDLDIFSINSEGTTEGKRINKRKRSAKRSNEGGFHELALSTVKEVIGIDQSDLVILESHAVYSLSREKTAANFYILQCTKPINEDLQVPIKDVIERMQGPLVGKSSSGWIVTPVVEYFHVLPYAGILTNWFSREVFSNSLQGSRIGLENVDVKNLLSMDDVCDKEVIKDGHDYERKSDGVNSVGKKSEENATELQDLRVGSEYVDLKSPQRIDVIPDKEAIEESDDMGKNSNVADSVSNDVGRTSTESWKQKDGHRSGLACLSDSKYGPQKMDDVNILQCTDNLCGKDAMKDREDVCNSSNRADSVGNLTGGTIVQLQDLSVVLECVDVKSPRRIDTISDKEVIKESDNSGKNSNATDSVGNDGGQTRPDSLKQRDDNGNGIVCLSDSYSWPHKMGAHVKSLQKIDSLCEGSIKDRDGSGNNSNGVDSVNKQAGGTTTKLQDLGMGLDNIDVKNPQGIGHPSDKKVIKGSNDSGKNSNATDSVRTGSGETNTEYLKQRNDNGSGVVCLPDSKSGLQNMDVGDSSLVWHQNENRSKTAHSEIKVYHHRKRMNNSADDNIHSKTKRTKVEMSNSMPKPCIPEVNVVKVDTGIETGSILSSGQVKLPMGGYAPLSSTLNSKYLEKLQSTLASKENALSQIALRILYSKRHKLSCQLRNLEDAIAVCDKNIQTILDEGEDSLALKIEAIVDKCDNVCLKGENEPKERTHSHFEDQCSHKYKRRTLSEAIFTLRKSCQELDDICLENNWILPTYNVSLGDDGFCAHVWVKGMDFECSAASDLQSCPQLARESAAVQMISKLRSISGQTQ